MVAKVEALPVLFLREDVEAAVERMPTREGEQSTIVAPSREVVVDEPEDQMASSESSDEDEKDKGKSPGRGVVETGTHIETVERDEWVPASTIIDDKDEMERTCCQSTSESSDDDEKAQMSSNQVQITSPTASQDLDLQMDMSRSRDPFQNIVASSSYGQAGPYPSATAHYARRDEDDRRPNFGGNGADDRPPPPRQHSYLGSVDEGDDSPTKRRKQTEDSKEAPAAAPGEAKGQKRKAEEESEEQSRKRRAGEREAPETMDDDLAWANRMDRELAANVARRRRDAAGPMGLDGAMSSTLRRHRNGDDNEDIGRRPSRLHLVRRAQWEAKLEELRTARAEQERLRKEDQRLNSEAFKAWMGERHGENIAPGQVPTFMPTLANQRRSADALERMRVMIERQEAEQLAEAKGRAENLRRQVEAEAVSEHLREVTAEEAFDEDGRRTEFEEARVKK